MRWRWGSERRSVAISIGVLAAVLVSPVVASSAANRAPDTTFATPRIPLHLPADHVYRHGAGADSSVVFSHESHLGYAGGQCTTCHPQPFLMLRSSPVPHHGEMNAGGSCGMCHDGKKAFGTKDASGCHTCHSGIHPQAMAASGPGGPPAGRPLPKPHAFPKGADSPGQVTFRHETHARNGCTTCHPKPYAMAAFTPPPGGAMHEKTSCGGCHDGKKAFATEDPDACERCHKDNGGTR